MIELVVASAIYAVSWQSAAANTARQQLLQCIRDASSKAKDGNVAADNFTAFVKNNCSAQESSLKSAMWSFDSKNKVSRRQSEADAQMQIDDFLATAEERYRMADQPQ